MTIKQISPTKANRIYEKAKIKGSAYFTLAGDTKILFSRCACLVGGYIYTEVLMEGRYAGFRIDTLKGNSSNAAFITSNNHVSPF